MKKMILLLTALLLMNAANAQILTTGSVNIRSGPGLDCETIGSIGAGEVLLYLHQTETDDRGVEWYHISYRESAGWVSSVYAKNLEFPAGEVSAEKISRYKEVAPYFDADDIEKASKEIGLDHFAYQYGNPGPIAYYDESLIFGVVDSQYMDLTGPGYTIFGAAVGMKTEEVRAKLEEAGLVFYDETEDRISFHRPVPSDSPMDWMTYDSILYARHQNGIVYALEWNKYTG